MRNLSLDAALRQAPVIAILRGLRPDEAVAVGRALVEAGVRVIEAPLNSPSPFESIRLLADALAGEAAIGAGTVLTEAEVDAVSDAGGTIVVSPNANPRVIRRALEIGLVPFPGIMTPTEMFAAVEAGARRLKLFPAGALGTDGLKAMLAVAPAGVEIFAVGGVGARNAREWLDTGAAGLGVGSDIYKPGDTAETVRSKARLLMDSVLSDRQ